MNDNEYYRCSDLPLVTFISLHYPIDSIDKTNSQRIIFLFKRNQSLDKLIEAYWRRELKVEPQLYFNQLKTIKSRLRNEYM